VLLRETLLLVRRECGGDLPSGGEELEPRIDMHRATAADEPLWRAAWPQKADWYLERLRGGRELCIVGAIDGRLAVHCWFCPGPYRDPQLGRTFDPGERGAYQGEGWVDPAWREKGLATAFIRRLYGEVLPSLGIGHVIAYFADDNLPSHRLHARFGFVETGRLLHVRCFGRHFFAPRPAAPARATGTTAAAQRPT
jgi:RimJ/RimL family protein N-acetyltransferase